MWGCNEIQEIGKYSILNSDNDTSMHPSGRSVAIILLYKASVCCFLSPPVEVMKTGLFHSEGCSHSLVVCEICSRQEQECSDYDDSTYELTEECTCPDYVEVSSGSYSEQFCGDMVPEPVTSAGSRMVIVNHQTQSANV